MEMVKYCKSKFNFVIEAYPASKLPKKVTNLRRNLMLVNGIHVYNYGM